MTIRRCLALALLSCTGCIPVPTVPEQQPVAAQPAVIAGPVTPDQVTPSNAQQMAESLRQEMDRAGRE